MKENTAHKKGADMDADKIAKGKRNLEKAVKELERASRNLCTLTLNKGSEDLKELPRIIRSVKDAWINADQFHRAYSE